MSSKARQDEDKDPFEEMPAPRRSATDELIDHYKEEAQRRDTIPYCYLYKYDDPKTGQEMQQVGQYAGEEIPDPHKIGLKFGSGRYGIKLYTAKGKAECKKTDWSTFKIHPIYDDYKAQADAATHAQELKRITGGTVSLPASIQPAQTTGEAFLMVKEIISMILPLLQSATRPTGSPRQETPAEMINSYSMMQKLLKTNLFDTAETLKQFSQRYQGPSQDAEIDDEPEAKEKNVVEKIIQMIEPFFALIANKSPAASLAAQGLRAAPQFIEILNDPALCRLIIQHFDRTKGKDAADMALRNIGIDRQKLFTIPTVAGGSTPRTNTTRAAPTVGNGNNGKTTPRPQGTAAGS